MLDKQDKCACHTCRQNELVEELLFYDWSIEGSKINKTFLLLLNAYMGSDGCDSSTPEARQETAYHLVMMQDTIEKLQQLQLLILQPLNV